MTVTHEFSEVPVGTRLVQIGWLAEDLPDVDRLADFIDEECRDLSGIMLDPLDDTTTVDTPVYHSHRQRTVRDHNQPSRYLRVYLAWEPTDMEPEDVSD